MRGGRVSQPLRRSQDRRCQTSFFSAIYRRLSMCLRRTLMQSSSLSRHFRRDDLPVAIIGAGPIGLAAAAHLLQRGETPIILEAGATVGANIANWGHVRFFSPWKYSIDAAARTLLEPQGWIAP